MREQQPLLRRQLLHERGKRAIAQVGETSAPVHRKIDNPPLSVQRATGNPRAAENARRIALGALRSETSRKVRPLDCEFRSIANNRVFCLSFLTWSSSARRTDVRYTDHNGARPYERNIDCVSAALILSQFSVGRARARKSAKNERG